MAVRYQNGNLEYYLGRSGRVQVRPPKASPFSKPNFRTAAAAVFVLCLWLVDWEGIRGALFEDLQGYIHNFRHGYYAVSDSASIIEWYSHEYLWRSAIYALGEYYSYEAIFAALAFFSLASMSAFVALKARSAIYLLVLVHPLLIDLVFSQVRSAAAISLIYLATLVRTRIGRLALVFVSPFVHSAVLAFTGAFAISEFRSSRWLRNNMVLWTAAYIVAVVVALTVLRMVLLDYLGDRRANAQATAGGLAMTLMLSCYGLPFLYRKLFSTELPAFFILMASVLCFTLYLTDQNGIRFVALAIPAFAVAISRIPNPNLRIGVFILALLSQLVYLGYWARGL